MLCHNVPAFAAHQHHAQAILNGLVLGLLHSSLEAVGLLVHLDLQLIGLVSERLQLVPHAPLLQVEIEPLAGSQLIYLVPGTAMAPLMPQRAAF